MTLQDELRRITPPPWKVVRSETCGHLRAAHNYRSDPREEWSDADIALIEAAPAMAGEIVRLKRRVNELADLVSGCGLTAEIADEEGISTEPEEWASKTNCGGWPT